MNIMMSDYGAFVLSSYEYNIGVFVLPTYLLSCSTLVVYVYYL